MRLAAICVLAARLAFAQAPAFEVASVKPAAPGTLGGRIDFQPGGRFQAENVALIFVLQRAYDVKDFQIVGSASMLAVVADGYNARYNLEGKGDSAATEAQLKEMVKSLLADRFRLKVHRETRDLPVYALIPSKGGVHLPAPVDDARIRGKGFVETVARGFLRGNNVTMPSLVEILRHQVDRPVIDKTGFQAAFDMVLTWTPEGSDATEGVCPAEFSTYRQQRGLAPGPMTCPSIFTAVQDQLGLRLEPRKEPIEVLVVDHAERPSSN